MATEREKKNKRALVGGRPCSGAPRTADAMVVQLLEHSHDLRVVRHTKERPQSCEMLIGADSVVGAAGHHGREHSLRASRARTSSFILPIDNFAPDRSRDTWIRTPTRLPMFTMAVSGEGCWRCSG